jgi:uracil-DNA glycosylase
MSKQDAYKSLVEQRKACSLCSSFGYKNQRELGFDTDEIGNFSTWANDLDADILIVAQDFSNQEIYLRDKGQIEPKPITEDSKPGAFSTATNYYLRELTKLIGCDIGLPTTNTGKGIFITNAVLCMKPGAMNAANPSGVIAHCGKHFLKPLIELVKPKAIVSLGAVPALSVLKAYASTNPELAALGGSAFGPIFQKGPIALGETGRRLFPMFHPGLLGQSQRKRAEPGGGNGWELMKADWLRINSQLG